MKTILDDLGDAHQVETGKNTVCLVKRTTFEGIFEHYTSKPPTFREIGLEMKGLTVYMVYDFDRWRRLYLPPPLPDQITRFYADSMRNYPQNSRQIPETALDSLERVINERIIHNLSAISISNSPKITLKQVTNRLQRLQNAYLDLNFTSFYIELRKKDCLLVINWTETGVLVKLMVSFETEYKEYSLNVKPGPQLFNLSALNCKKINRIVLKNEQTLLSNTIRMSSEEFTVPGERLRSIASLELIKGRLQTFRYD